MFTNILDLFEKGALLKCPEKVAIIEGDVKISFSVLADNAKKLALSIIKKCNDSNKCVAVLLKNGVDILTSDLAVLYSAHFYTNLDSKSPTDRLRNIINNLQPVLFIVDDANISLVETLGIAEDKVLNVNNLPPYIDSEKCVIGNRRALIIDTDPLCVMNTSGSTGAPKSCILNHRGMLDYAFWAFEAMKLKGDEISGVIPAFYFDGYLTAFFNCLYNGATFVVAPDGYVAFPMKLAEYFSAFKISFIFWVPSVLVTFVATDILTKVDLSSLKVICFAGEVFSTAHYNYWKRHIPEAVYVNLYGPIEISVICTSYIVSRDFKDDEPLPIGSPCYNTGIILLKDDNTRALDGEIGEICVRGSSLALGYYNNPEKTADVFVQNPLNMHYPELIYKTGDLAYINKYGEIIFIGRKDFQIKHMGYRIELGEIEYLAAAIADVKHVCILYNKEKKEITMFYEAEKELLPRTIRSELSKTLPKYSLPVVFYHLDELPRNANGKIDRQLLSHRM